MGGQGCRDGEGGDDKDTQNVAHARPTSRGGGAPERPASAPPSGRLGTRVAHGEGPLVRARHRHVKMDLWEQEWAVVKASSDTYR